jgi:ubiquinone/menaquinone biosynthesis C-methylase UbiE
MNDRGEKQTEFDRYASHYHELIRDPVRERFAASSVFFAERKLQVIRRFCERAGIEPETREWLDIGCGQGELLRAGQRLFRTASGCDPSAGMLEYCSDLSVRQQKSQEALPFENRRFDFITIVCVYHHVAIDRRSALTDEALRVLRPGGILCVIEHNPWNPMTRLIVSRTPVDAEAELLSSRSVNRLMSAARISVLASRFFLFFPERIHSAFPVLENALERVPIGGQYAVFGKKC